MPPQSDTLDLVPDSRAVACAIEWLEAIAEREAWSPKLSFGLSLSLDEALTNIVSYAFDDPLQAPEPARVHLACRQDAEWISLEIIDNGRPYDPTLTPPPPLAASLDDAEIGGHGVRLMQHYLHDLRYARAGNENHLTLVMRAA
ncbi:MAG: ATP-binding protein [Achromobacter pulmonis]|uniref:Serine/threonine-protein kinase BtrW n=1 Tax=Achromobacter pulmonis TaxID=1389932 RepID=A0A6S7ED87_9BURK|nr:ATP-binding protein [Achromobacter pulmonis]MCF7766945.1 ATP-binding protein [Achromobacter pulmonis]MPT27946.1 ATP-binding protein [Achromobacter sp.]CAB3902432.1 Serine/threonine-protein kinase BtrW [Achromobacter pulmonis]